MAKTRVSTVARRSTDMKGTKYTQTASSASARLLGTKTTKNAGRTQAGDTEAATCGSAPRSPSSLKQGCAQAATCDPAPRFPAAHESGVTQLQTYAERTTSPTTQPAEIDMNCLLGNDSVQTPSPLQAQRMPQPRSYLPLSKLGQLHHPRRVVEARRIVTCKNP